LGRPRTNHIVSSPLLQENICKPAYIYIYISALIVNHIDKTLG
jgi:hypothetical protein